MTIIAEMLSLLADFDAAPEIRPDQEGSGFAYLMVCLALGLILIILIAAAWQQAKRVMDCPDCNKLVSRLAAVCPHCGRPLK
jgi:hypothetical protein